LGGTTIDSPRWQVRFTVIDAFCQRTGRATHWKAQTSKQVQMINGDTTGIVIDRHDLNARRFPEMFATSQANCGR
jgi:hypothetical protein